MTNINKLTEEYKPKKKTVQAVDVPTVETVNKDATRIVTTQKDVSDIQQKQKIRTKY